MHNHCEAVISSLDRELAAIRLQGRSLCIVLGLNLEDQELIEKFGALAYHNIKAFQSMVYRDEEKDPSSVISLEEVFERKLYQAVCESLNDRITRAGGT